MEEKKKRYYTTPSSLGSYFGVGFNSPQDQIQIDLGILENDFDEEAQKRLLLGKVLEDATLNYFEQAMNIEITNRNNDMMFFYDNKIKGIVDGMTVLNGKKTVVECKISNASSYKFTEKMSYIIQVQAYMLATDTEQALLCGLHNGKPIYKIIKRDENIIDDIKKVTDFVINVLVGLETFDNYPVDILEKYSSKEQILPELNKLTDTEKENINVLLVLKEQKKNLDEHIKKIEKSIKEKYDIGCYETDNYKLTLTKRERQGNYDIDRLSIEHPEIDYEKYRKPNTTFKIISLRKKRHK